MNKLIAMTALITSALSTGCTVYSYDTYDDATVIVYEEEINYAPEVIDAYAGPYFDDLAWEDVWEFEAVIDDINGPYDVIDVWADVYDEYRGGVLVASFQLHPTNDAYLWVGDFSNFGTGLDPFYDGYTVDFVAYDSWDDYGVMTVWSEFY